LENYKKVLKNLKYLGKELVLKKWPSRKVKRKTQIHSHRKSLSWSQRKEKLKLRLKRINPIQSFQILIKNKRKFNQFQNLRKKSFQNNHSNINVMLVSYLNKNLVVIVKNLKNFQTQKIFSMNPKLNCPVSVLMIEILVTNLLFQWISMPIKIKLTSKDKSWNHKMTLIFNNRN
jgi:hypothetical protein